MLTKRGRYLASGIFDGLGTQVLGASRLLTDLFCIAPGAHAEAQAPVFAVGQERNEI